MGLIKNMKEFLILSVIIINFCSCSITENDNEIEKVAYKSLPNYLEGIDNIKLATSNWDTTFYNLDSWNNASILNESNEENLNIEVKIIDKINTSYSHIFCSVIVGVYEGGDCGPGYYLYNFKDSLELGSCLLAIECVTDLEFSEHYSIKTSDSTFQVIMKASGPAFDPKTAKYILGKSFKRILKSDYLIKSTGEIIIKDTTDNFWIADEEYKHRF